MKNNVQHIIDHFFEEGKFFMIDPIDQGLINDTYLIGSPEAAEKFILQRINKHVFREPLKVMHNLTTILDHLSEKTSGRYHYLRLKKTHGGKDFHVDQKNDYWRVFVYLDHTLTYDQPAGNGMAYEASRAFGNFLKNLHDLDPARLYETIPGFHDYNNRLRLLDEAEHKDSENRLSRVNPEMEFIRKRSKYIETFYRLHLPGRPIHGDTKINNILFNSHTKKAVCVIDLDLAMPGPLLYDYGDMVRSYTNETAEDDPSTGNVNMNLEIFGALTEGFLAETSGFITRDESDNLLLGAKVVILVQVIRYITDYLSGDPYYKIKYPEHNLDRTRNQLRLLEALENHEQDLRKIIDSVKSKTG